MATVEQCEEALHGLAGRMAGSSGNAANGFDRSLSCSLNDLAVVFGGRLHDGQLTDIAQIKDPAAQIRLTMTSDDLLRLVDGELNLAKAWASGRIKVQAGVRDLLKLRSIF